LLAPEKALSRGVINQRIGHLGGGAVLTADKR
jgi:hypothetical protein